MTPKPQHLRHVHGCTYAEFDQQHDGECLVVFSHGFDPFPGSGSEIMAAVKVPEFIQNHPQYAIHGVYELRARPRIDFIDAIESRPLAFTKQMNRFL